MITIIIIIKAMDIKALPILEDLRARIHTRASVNTTQGRARSRVRGAGAEVEV
jgi:hypothetical protein